MQIEPGQIIDGNTLEYRNIFSTEWKPAKAREYRLKPNCKPEPKRVPLTLEDWKGIWWLRRDPISVEWMVVGFGEDGLRISNGDWKHFRELLAQNWQRSTDREHWTECSKLEAA